MANKIIFKKEKSTGRITLNNTKKLNALDFGMIIELHQIL